MATCDVKDDDTGSAITGWTEANIVSGAKKIRLTLTDDTWIAAGGGSTKCIQSASATTNTIYTRYFTMITVGTLTFKMRISITNPDDFSGVVLQNAADSLIYIRFGPTGNIEAYNNTGAIYVSQGAYSINTWYTISVDFDHANFADQFRVKVNAGAWSARYSTADTLANGINRLRIDDSATTAHTFWLDDISGTNGWIATEDAESYTVTNNLDTLNGGTNWTTAWAKASGGAVTIQAMP